MRQLLPEKDIQLSYKKVTKLHDKFVDTDEL